MKKILTALFCCLLSFAANAQQMLADQQINSPVAINPAACGQYAGLTISGAYRQQWSSISNSPKSFYAIAEYKFPSKDETRINSNYNKGLPLMGKWALIKPPKQKTPKPKFRPVPADSVRNFFAAGLRAQTEKIGFVNHTKLGVTATFHRNLYQGRFLSFGVNLGFMQSKLDLSQAILEDPTEIDVLSQLNNTRPTLGFGAYYYSNSLIAGVSVMDIGANKNSFFRADQSKLTLISYPSTVYGTIGILREISPMVELAPAATIRYSAGYNEVLSDITCKAFYNKRFMLGAGYRTSKAPLFFAGILWNNSYSLNYCYGAQKNAAISGAKSVHEIGLSMNLKTKNSANTPQNYRWR